jgi:hypothetical protein
VWWHSVHTNGHKNASAGIKMDGTADWVHVAQDTLQ